MPVFLAVLKTHCGSGCFLSFCCLFDTCTFPIFIQIYFVFMQLTHIDNFHRTVILCQQKLHVLTITPWFNHDFISKKNLRIHVQWTAKWWWQENKKTIWFQIHCLPFKFIDQTKKDCQDTFPLFKNVYFPKFYNKQKNNYTLFLVLCTQPVRLVSILAVHKTHSISSIHFCTSVFCASVYCLQ